MNKITMKIILDEIKWARRKNSGVLEIDDSTMIDNIETAVEKQISTKAVKRHYRDLDCGELYEEGHTYHCPECENEVGATSLTFKEISWQTEYCCDCGKRLDWD